jgi:HD-GYP domain-containing protein (c-di-GMP phosphodiesterase class II)
MTSKRPYKRALTLEEAIEELKRCSGTQFDPKLVEIMVSVIEEELKTY